MENTTHYKLWWYDKKCFWFANEGGWHRDCIYTTKASAEQDKKNIRQFDSSINLEVVRCETTYQFDY